MFLLRKTLIHHRLNKKHIWSVVDFTKSKFFFIKEILMMRSVFIFGNIVSF